MSPQTGIHEVGEIPGYRGWAGCVAIPAYEALPSGHIFVIQLF